MIDVHTFRLDDKYGVPDAKIREFLNKCEKSFGEIDVRMHDIVQDQSNGKAHLLVVVVMKVNV